MPTELGTNAPRSTDRWRTWKRWLFAFAAFLTVVIILDWWNGTFQSEFGRHPDEGIHYVSGRLIRDFALSPREWTKPMPFARDFYAHYPKVALGHYPPLFEILQAAWSLVFGASRVSMLVGMAVMTALLAVVVFRSLTMHTGTSLALLAGILTVAAPIAQAHEGMVMAEIPLALFSLLSVLAWTRFEYSRTASDALKFAAWTITAILTKGNAYAIPLTVAVSLIVNRDWLMFKRKSFWLSVGAIAGVCIPYTLLTIRITLQGFDSRTVPDATYILASMVKHVGFVIAVLGAPLFLLAVCGLIFTAARSWVTKKPNYFWSNLAVYGIAIVVFHGAVPTSIEPRKVFQVLPVLCIFVAAALALLVPVFGKHPSRWQRLPHLSSAALAFFCLALFLLTGFRRVEPFIAGVRPAVSNLIARPDTHGAAILISSGPVFQDLEAAFIAEWLSRTNDRSSYLVRGTKLLSKVVVSNGDITLEPVTTRPEDISRILNNVPISFVVTHDTPWEYIYGHQPLLQKVVSDPHGNWEPIFHSRQMMSGKPHEISIFRSRRETKGAPIHLEIDLTQKINESITVNQSGLDPGH